MSTEIATRPAEVATVQPGAIEAIRRMDPQSLAVIKTTVANGATDAELAMFLELAARYQLDPFAKEIWCICEMKDGQRVPGKPAQIMASRDGYLAIANRNPMFDGMESDVVREGDTFRRARGEVEHTYGAKRGGIIGAYALVYRKDRSRPAYFFAPWSDYGQRNAGSSWSPWSKYPSAMTIKVAEAMALKRAFSISGLVTEEEMGMEPAAPRQTLAPAAPALPSLDGIKGFAERYQAILQHVTAKGLDAKTVWTEAGVTAQRDLEDDEVYAQARRAVGDDPDAGEDAGGGSGDEPVTGEIVDDPITEEQRRWLHALANEHGFDHATLKQITEEATGQDSTTAIKASELDAVAAKVREWAEAA